MSRRQSGTTELGAGQPVAELLEPRLLGALERAPLFHAVSRRHRRRIAQLAEFRRYADGEAVVRAGERGVAFYVVLDGEARVVPARGRQHRLAVGDEFGELSLFDDAPRAADVNAIGTLTTARIARLDFARLLREEPALAVGMLPGLALVVRDLAQAHAQRTPDLGQLSALAVEGEAPKEAAATVLEERTALGWRSLLGRVPLFAELSGRHLGRVARLATIVRYPEQATVVVAGAKGESFHVILDGRARVRTPSGHTRTLEVNDYFGELALLDGAPRAATVVATSALTTAQIRRSDFQKLLRDDPAIAAGLSKSLVRTIRDMQ